MCFSCVNYKFHRGKKGLSRKALCTGAVQGQGHQETQGENMTSRGTFWKELDSLLPPPAGSGGDLKDLEDGNYFSEQNKLIFKFSAYK